jgi:hypothetical protein
MSPPSRNSLVCILFVVPLLACSALVVTGCGGSGKNGSATSTTPVAGSSTSVVPSPAGGPAAALAGVRGRILEPGEMAGFTPAGRRLIGTNPDSWAVALQVPAAQRATVVALLRRLGFVAALREDLVASGGVPGLSMVEQFRSPSGARGELAAVVQQFKTSIPAPDRFTSFPVPGIPGARGLATTLDTGANVGFTKGSYYYLIGVAGARPGTPGAPNRATVIAAARHLYHRVHQ